MTSAPIGFMLGLSLFIALAVAGCEPGVSRQENFSDRDAGELTTVKRDRDVIPANFHGRWAADQEICNDEDQKGVERVTAGRIFSGYESDAVLLKAALAFESTPDGKSADTVLALVAQSGEGELGFQKLRISRTSRHLYMSELETDDAQHWAHPLIRCAD